MIWIVCGAFAGGILTGVLLMALLFVAKERGVPTAGLEEEGLVQRPYGTGMDGGLWHLTPRGWVPGGPLMGSTRKTGEPPADRVLTCSCNEGLLSVCGSGPNGLAEVWRCEDSAAVRKLMDKYGDRPQVEQSPGEYSFLGP